MKKHRSKRQQAVVARKIVVLCMHTVCDPEAHILTARCWPCPSWLSRRPLPFSAFASGQDCSGVYTPCHTTNSVCLYNVPYNNHTVLKLCVCVVRFRCSVWYCFVMVRVCGALSFLGELRCVTYTALIAGGTKVFRDAKPIVEGRGVES